MKPALPSYGIAGRLAAAFLNAKLTPLVVIASLLLGLFAVLSLPREEEPQIQVPMIDLITSLPGADPAEVESRITRPLEQWLWETPDLEYLYSTSSPGQSLIVARFKVGTALESALVRVQQRVEAHRANLPASPQVQPRTIDDVPVLALTLHSASHPPSELRRLALQLAEDLRSVPGVAETRLLGAGQREARVEVSPAALQAHGLSMAELARQLSAAQDRRHLGVQAQADGATAIQAGTAMLDAEQIGKQWVQGAQGPILIEDLATVRLSAAEPTAYVWHRGTGPQADWEGAVTLTLAKRPGVNAVSLVEALEERLAAIRVTLVPAEVEITVTRDYGHTAAEKGNELLLHMGIAVVGVSLLILLFLGWREAGVVLLAIPATLGLTLLVFYLYGYTLNRITLFALIFSIGILVDDAIVVVENMVRRFRQPEHAERPWTDVAVEAVDEVGNSTLLATWAVIAAILPMAFVGGLMGPYMRPIPIGATAAMLFSVLIAFTVTPWAALRMLRRTPGGTGPSAHGTNETTSAQTYYRILRPLLERPRRRWAFLTVILVALLGSLALVPLGKVKVKMLPFDNKAELQLILNTPESMNLEDTLRVAMALAREASEEPEVAHTQVYAGTAAPFNFNGLVRHYFLRQGPNVADVQLNLVPKGDRRAQSHDVALRLRKKLAPLAARNGVALAVAEVPPGPPVLQTLVAEIYAPDAEQRDRLAARVKHLLESTRGVVDVDWYREDPQPRLRYVPRLERLGLAGLPVTEVTENLQAVWSGLPAGSLRDPRTQEQLPIRVTTPQTLRSTPEALLAYPVASPREPGRYVPLAEWVEVRTEETPRSLYRKNLRPVTYVTADLEGDLASPAYALASLHPVVAGWDAREFGGRSAELAVHHLSLPTDPTQPGVKWDGEWHVTLEVFRDLGLAFAAVLVLIALLMVGWFKSYRVPLIVMVAIPFSLIGILPAHAAFGAFFTATSMIGFMAGGGIVVRNSIILVDFIEQRRREGATVHDAVLEAGAVRFRPMLLTALAVVVGASVMLGDPIFQGLAISLMFGEIASLLISRLAVPVLYAWFSPPLSSHEQEHR